ncbi:hypothetical protein OROMI_007749 [Orobanche minor]
MRRPSIHTGITVGRIGRVEKMVNLLFGDRRPIDWLDLCCYCHDIGYDTHDQAELLKADLAFLECLERPNMSTKGDPQVAYVYKFMCTSGAEEYIDSLQAAASEVAIWEAIASSYVAEQYQMDRMEAF